MRVSELAGFYDFMLSFTADKDSELAKYFFNIQTPALYYKDIRKGKRLLLKYSYDTEEEKIDEKTTKHEVITKTVPVKIIKIRKEKPTLHIDVEEI